MHDRPINFTTYQIGASATAIYPGRGTTAGLTYVGLKLAEEAGEVAGKIGKALRDDGLKMTDNYCYMDPKRRAALKRELGDVLWYLSAAADELGWDLVDIAEENLKKLADRAERGAIRGDGDSR